METKIRLFADTATDSDATTLGPTDMIVPGATGTLLNADKTGNSSPPRAGRFTDA
ncbi:MAG TPA: hypothetical protein VFE08_00695 [Candidatus Sulfotelmatobacter sp.]|nr:hypothetical protein [Candidatus Sulfotelmatobacter sp.]